MTRHVALLRGINVGGKNLVRMADLAACFEAGGFDAVATYIQSGNVVFATDEPSPGALEPQIEQILAARFGLPIRVLVRTARQMRDIIDRAPAGFGAEPNEYRYDVLYLKGLDPTTAIAKVPAREGVDNASTGPGVLYFSRLIAKAAQSQLSRLASLPIYQDITIRNWNTTLKLSELVAECER